ncbi:MAG: RNA polymerase sigma factor [Phycisphaerae bacterium]|jgi:RNA polymerase sigma-70 factor (ECF subfamily)
MDNDQPPPTDWELVKRARSGHVGSFHELVDRHAPMLYGLAMRLVGRAEDAQDLVQETFSGAFRGLRAFGGRSAVKTWLSQILVRQAARYYKKEYRRRAILLDQRPTATGPPGQSRADLRMDIAEAILALEPPYREIIVLRELQGMTYDEIAAVLRVPRGTVESRLFRARRRLQELLKEYFFGPRPGAGEKESGAAP